jgi:hypothetical protein
MDRLNITSQKQCVVASPPARAESTEVENSLSRADCFDTAVTPTGPFPRPKPGSHFLMMDYSMEYWIGVQRRHAPKGFQVGTKVCTGRALPSSPAPWKVLHIG